MTRRKVTVDPEPEVLPTAPPDEPEEDNRLEKPKVKRNFTMTPARQAAWQRAREARLANIQAKKEEEISRFIEGRKKGEKLPPARKLSLLKKARAAAAARQQQREEEPFSDYESDDYEEEEEVRSPPPRRRQSAAVPRSRPAPQPQRYQQRGVWYDVTWV